MGRAPVTAATSLVTPAIEKPRTAWGASPRPGAAEPEVLAAVRATRAVARTTARSRLRSDAAGQTASAGAAGSRSPIAADVAGSGEAPSGRAPFDEPDAWPHLGCR